MKTKIIVRSFTVNYHHDDGIINEQIEKNVAKYEGKLISATEQPIFGAKIRVRIYLEVPDNTEENKS